MQLFRPFTLLPIFLSLALSAFAADSSYKVAYGGGSLPTLRSGDEVKLFIDPTLVRLVDDRMDVLAIPGTAITSVTYGQNVHGLLPRFSPFNRSRRRYIGLTWTYGVARGGVAIQCSDSEFRGIVTALEGVSGRHPVDTDLAVARN